MPNDPNYKRNVSNNERAAQIWSNLPNNLPKPLKRPELKDRTGEKDYRRGLLDSLFWENDKQKDRR